MPCAPSSQAVQPTIQPLSRTDRSCRAIPYPPAWVVSCQGIDAPPAAQRISEIVKRLLPESCRVPESHRHNPDLAGLICGVCHIPPEHSSHFRLDLMKGIVRRQEQEKGGSRREDGESGTGDREPGYNDNSLRPDQASLHDRPMPWQAATTCRPLSRADGMGRNNENSKRPWVGPEPRAAQVANQGDSSRRATRRRVSQPGNAVTAPCSQEPWTRMPSGVRTSLGTCSVMPTVRPSASV